MTPTSLNKIKQTFDKQFAVSGLTLPDEDLRTRSSGSLTQQGWTINYRFGTQQGEEYLEYFASHRMTNDTLHRIYADGREELVGCCQEFYVAGDEQSKQDYYNHNRQFYEEVRRKGLD